jgi:Mrp family chromosome partitioning ATPase
MSSSTVAEPSTHGQPEANVDDVDRLRSLNSAERSRQESTAGPGSEIVWAFIRPEVLDACSIALRRMGGVDRSVAVTSASRREGRTTVAVGLAAAAASQHNRTTILLDLDLERGGIGKQTSVQSSPGVTDFLRGHAGIEDCLQETSEGLAIISAGALCEPSEMGARLGRLSYLIAELRERSEVLIADLPPLSSGVVAASMADLFESVALVVRAGRVAVPHIEKSVAVLTQRPFVILNAEAGSRSSRIRKPLQSFRP